MDHTKAQKSSFLEEFRLLVSPKTSVLFASSFIIPLAAFMLYPFLTIFFTHRLHFSAAEAGLLLSIRFLSSGLLGFVSGWLSNRLGMARTYTISGTVTALVIVLLAFQTGLWPIVVLLVLMGVSESSVKTTVRALSNQALPEEHRGAGQNYMYWLNNVGMAVAMPVSSFALHGGLSQIPFFVAAAAYLIMAGVMAAGFGSHDRPPSETGSNIRHSVAPWTILRQDRAFALLMASFILWVMVEMQFESDIPLDLSYHLPHGAALYGALGAMDMILVFVLQLAVSRWLSTRKSPWYGYMGFLLLGGLAIGGFWQTTVGWGIAIILLALGDVFSISQIMALMGVIPRDGQQAAYFAIFGMAQGMATFLAYALGGTAYQLLHPAVLFSLCVPAAVLSAIFYRAARVRAAASESEAA